MSPLVASHRSFACSISFVSVSFVSVRFLRQSCRWSSTRRWPNSGLLLVHRPRRWANISPVLGYRVAFDATLNVGQRHRWRASNNPALVKASCRNYSQHEVGLLTTVEWILASTGDAGPTFNRHWFGVGLHCQTCSPANTGRWSSAAGSVDKPHLCFAHHRVWRY